MADNNVEEIKSKIDIVELISEYVQLKRSGVNFRGLCPFHNEKTPSFFVSPERQIWHCFGCFPKGSLIKKENGFIPIEDIKRGDQVITGKGVKKKVLLTMKRDYNGELISVRTRKCNEVVNMTADHEVYVVKAQTKYFQNYKIEKISAEDLTKNDYLIYPINQKIKDSQFLYLSKYLNRALKNYGPKTRSLKNKIKIDDSLLKLLGYYIAEGSNHRAYIRFSLGPRELDFAQEIQVLLKKIFSLESGIHIIRKDNKKGIEVTCCNSNLSNIFENLCGKGAENKHIPDEFIFLPPQKQKIIVEAIWKGDGHISKKGRKSRAGQKSITSISRILIYQIKDILLRLSFEPSLFYFPPKIDKNNVKHGASFTVNWREDLRASYTSFLTQNKIKYWLLPITQISRRDFKGTVYNLTIDKIHSYIANHFVVGNCGKGGDIFTFIQEIEGTDFPEALRILAEKAGVQIKTYDSHNISQRTKLLDICSLSAKFYHKILLDSPLAESTRKYLQERGIKKEIIAEFQLGFSPDKWNALLKFLLKRGYKENEIESAGLIIKKQQGSGYYDRFRNRLMFPISNTHGHVVGFTARVLPLKGKAKNKNEGKVAKYINTPETEIYNKKQILYGLDKAKLEAKLQDYFILVEGNMDVLSCHQAKNKNTVCTSGTSLTMEQIKLLKRYVSNVFLAFDIDSAGQIATNRSIGMLLNQGLNVKIIDLKGHKDPDEFIQKNPKAWAKALERPMPIMEYYFSYTFSRYQKDKKALTIEAKKEIAKSFLPVIAKLGDFVEQGLWVRRLADELSISEVFLRDALEKIKMPKVYNAFDKEKKDANDIEKASLEQQAAERLLGLILKYPKLGENFLKKQSLLLDIFPSVQTQNIAKFIRDYYNRQKKIDAKKIKEGMKEIKLVNYCDFLLFLAEKEFAEDSPLEITKGMFSFFSVLRRKYLKSKMQEALVELREAEKSEDKKLIGKISKRIIKLSRDLAD